MSRLLLETDPALPLVQVAVTTLTGSVHDPVGKEGLSRLLARLMRRTPAGLSADAVDARLDQLGSSLGADVSGSSSGFSGSVISRNRSPFSDLIRDVVCAPSLDEAELGRLKRETLAELQELLDSDRALARRWFRRALFGGHPYGRSTAGTAESIASINLNDVKEHYQSHFTSDNLIVALAGDVQRQEGEELLAALTKDLPTSAAPLDSVEHPGGPTGKTLWVVDKPDRTQTQILIGGLGGHPSDTDHTALLVANTVFGGTFTSRLTQEVRGKRGWSYGASSSLPFDRKRQAFSMSTFPAAEDAAECVKLQLSLMNDWVEHGITAEELSYAKSYLEKSYVFSIDTAAKRMGLLLDEQVYGLPKDYYKSYPDRVRTVTLEQANAAVRNRISTDNVAIVVAGTEKLIGPALRDAVGDVREYRVVPFDAP